MYLGIWVCVFGYLVIWVFGYLGIWGFGDSGIEEFRHLVIGGSGDLGA